MAAPVPKIRGMMVTLIPTTDDWDSRVQFPNGMHLEAICFCPSAVNDKIALFDIGNQTSSTPTLDSYMFPFVADVTGGGVTWYYCGQKYVPYLDYSACVFTTYGNAKILIQLAAG